MSAATLSTEPLVLGKYLRPGTHVDLIGSFTPVMRESDDACFDGTSVFIDTNEAPMKSGDLLSPMKNGVLLREQIRADLASLCRSEHPGRTTDQEVTVFKAVGTALEDLAAANICFQACSQL
ncbi:ornithine cyclodeaminase [compost metagenome]